MISSFFLLLPAGPGSRRIVVARVVRATHRTTAGLGAGLPLEVAAFPATVPVNVDAPVFVGACVASLGALRPLDQIGFFTRLGNGLRLCATRANRSCVTHQLPAVAIVLSDPDSATATQNSGRKNGNEHDSHGEFSVVNLLILYHKLVKKQYTNNDAVKGLFVLLWTSAMIQFKDSDAQRQLTDLHRREEETLVQSLASQQGLGYIDLAVTAINVDALRLLDEAVARKAEVAVYAQGNDTVSVALRNPKNPDLAPTLEILKGKGFTPLLFMVSYGSLTLAWDHYKDVKKATAETRGVLEIDPEAIKAMLADFHSHLDVAARILEIQKSTVANRLSKMNEVIFAGALALGASDIHIEPEAYMVRLRYRLDGVLWDVVELESALHGPMMSRFKLLSGLKLNEKKKAQDGRFTFDIGTRSVEVRSSVIPGAFGESIVMRLLDPDASSFQLEALGLNARLHTIVLEELARPNGAFITTGPTGSGKTTALYAFLQHIHTPQVKIITLEDPIEYKLPGVVQTQVGPGYTFANGLRSILRQDPDVIMVGEIRDHEVAETAVHAALTGHLVFSTLHTNSAAGAFARLINLGVQPHMVGSAFNIVLGQRLVRKLCEHCKISRDATTEEQRLIAQVMDQPVALQTIHDAKGCEKCSMSGYKGRIGVFEAIRVDDVVEEIIIRDPRDVTIREAAKSQGIPNMQQDGVMKALAGITSLDELERVLDLHNMNPPDLKPEAAA